MLDWIRKHILLSAVIFAAAGVAAELFLMLFHMRFRIFVIQTIAIISFVGIVAGLIQLIRRLDKKALRVGSYFAMAIVTLVLLISLGLPMLIFFAGTSESSQILYGKRYSARREEFLDIYVDYYDYENFFISGNVIRYEDDYPGCAVGDPIRTQYYENGMHSVIMGQGG